MTRTMWPEAPAKDTERDTFWSAPARETGATQHALGAVAPGRASIRTPTARLRVTTEQLESAGRQLVAASDRYSAAAMLLWPTLWELETVWSSLSPYAADAAHLLREVRHRLEESAVTSVDYADKLRLAALAYDQAEAIAERLTTVFDAIHGVGWRLAYTSVLGLNPVGAVVAAGGIVAVTLADSRARGAAAATSSVIRGSGVDVPSRITQMGAVKGVTRSMGLGVPRLASFGRLTTAEPVQTERPATLESMMDRIHRAGERDVSLDALAGKQNDVATAHLDVARVTRPDGSTAYVVSVPGTDFDNVWSLAEPNGALSTLDAVTAIPDAPLRESPALMQLVDRSLEHAGANSGSPVFLSGFSQGGMAAMALAANKEFTGKYRVAGVLTAGAPTQPYRGVDPTIPVAHLVDVNDPVPRLAGGGSTPSNDHAMLIHTNAEGRGGGATVMHGSSEYARGGRAADPLLGATAEGRKYQEALQGAMPAGSTVETMTYGATSEFLPRLGAAASEAPGVGSPQLASPEPRPGESPRPVAAGS